MTLVGSHFAKVRLALGLSAALALSACSGGGETEETSETTAIEEQAYPLAGAVTLERLPTPTDPQLIAGAQIWDSTCRGCHGLGIADSPKITDIEAWAPRIAQGTEILYQHALEGHFGPKGTMMPPRGGNDALTDDEVKSAVDFMIANSQ